MTRNRHENGPVGVMTDYEAKFHELGQPICRCVATMVPWEEPFPTDPEIVAEQWLDTFAVNVSEAELGADVYKRQPNIPNSENKKRVDKWKNGWYT